MKKFFSLIIAFVCCMFVFAGCTHVAGTEVTGITFTSDHYYLDLGVPTKLDYRFLPNTSQHLSPVFDPQGSEFDVLSKITLDKSTGYLTINDSTFDKTEVILKYGYFTDSCIVELKKYPSSIRVKDDVVYISSNGILQIPYFGNFAGEEKLMDLSFYRTRVTSSDSTVITVENQDNVIVKSTGKRGRATIKIEVIASDGSKISGLETSVDVVVNNNISDCSMFVSYLDAEGKTVSNIYRNLNNDETELSFNDDTLEYTIEPFMLDNEGFIIENVNCSFLSLNENVVKIIDNGDGTFKFQAIGNGSTQIIVSSNGYAEGGEVIIFKIECNVNKS